MPKFRKKPVVIDAVRWMGDNTTEVIDWVINSDSGCARYHDAEEEGRTEYLAIDTPEGIMRANIGDWIIRGVKGEHYPCKPDIFRVTYERSDAVAEDSAVDTNTISDGYHTFGELYAHRRALTAALAALTPGSWRSKAHHPDSDPIFAGYFIVGIPTPGGPITYHYELQHWDDFAALPEVKHAPEWDGAPPSATVDRLLAWAIDRRTQAA